MIKFFNKFKKTIFGPFFKYFLNFGGKNNFKKTCHAQLHMGYNKMPKFRKKMIQFQQNVWKDGWTKIRRKDGQNFDCKTKVYYSEVWEIKIDF